MLLKNDTTIIRVLKTQDSRSLVIDCIKRTMPKWMDTSSLSAYTECSEAYLYIQTGMIRDREFTPDEQRIAQERYTMIAPVLPFIGNEQKRSQMIDLLSQDQSKQTIRKYLCLYLAYQSVSALAPSSKVEPKELTKDEKNFRWALNKFYYTQQKYSLPTAYTMMLQAKYCDSNGLLMDEHPSFTQFRYFYRKTKKIYHYVQERYFMKRSLLSIVLYIIIQRCQRLYELWHKWRSHQKRNAINKANIPVP